MMKHSVWARQTPIKPQSAKTLLLVLASHANTSDIAWASVPTLAYECSMSERGVFKSIQMLLSNIPPLIEIVKAAGSNHYRLIGDFDHRGEDEAIDRPLNVVHPCPTFTPEPGSPLNDVHPTPERSSSPPCPTFIPPLNVVHPKERTKEREKGRSKEKSAPGKNPPDDLLNADSSPVATTTPEQEKLTPEHTTTPDQAQQQTRAIQSPKSAKCSTFDPAAIELPAEIPPEAWLMWCEFRAERKKPVTAVSARLTIKGLIKARQNGWPPQDLIETAIRSGWQGCVFDKHLLNRNHDARQTDFSASPSTTPTTTNPEGFIPHDQPRYDTFEQFAEAHPNTYKAGSRDHGRWGTECFGKWQEYLSQRDSGASSTQPEPRDITDRGCRIE